MSLPPNGTVATYDAVANAWVAGVGLNVDLFNQSAALSNVIIDLPSVSGVFLVSMYSHLTQVASGGTSIAQVGGAHASESAGATSLTVTYSPTAGHASVVMFATGNTISGLVVKDNLGNTLVAGPSNGLLSAWHQFPVPSGVTSYIATWTTARQASLIVEEYSGVVGVDTGLTGNTNSGNSGTATIAPTTTVANEWIVGGLSDVASNTLTGTVGQQRQQTLGSAVTCPITLMDNTAASPGSVTCTATLASAAWTGVAIGLQPLIPSSILGGVAGCLVQFTCGDCLVGQQMIMPMTDGSGNMVKTNSTNVLATGILSGSVVINAEALQNITFSFDYSSVGSTPMLYSTHAKVVYLGALGAP